MGATSTSSNVFNPQEQIENVNRRLKQFEQGSALTRAPEFSQEERERFKTDPRLKGLLPDLEQRFASAQTRQATAQQRLRQPGRAGLLTARPTGSGGGIL